MIRVLRSTSLRLALVYAAIFILSSLLLVGVVWWRTAAYLQQETDAVILADAQAIGDRLQDFGLPGAIETIDQRIATPSDDEHAIYFLGDPTLSRVAGNLVAWPAELGSDPGWYQIELERHGRLHATRVLFVRLAGGFDLLVGRDVQDRVAIQQLILDGLAWAAGTAVLLAIGGGLLVRRSVMGRVDAINRTAAAIVQGDLTQRVPMRGSSDEFDQLAQTINGLLQQIEILIDGVRNASNAVAHDLRTPLAELRGRLEGLFRARPDPQTTFGELEGAVSDLDRLIGIFNALLRLAEIDSGARLTGFTAVRIDQIIDEVADLYLPVAEENGVSIVTVAPPGLFVTGDPYLLAQAIGNLVDNAVKFSPVGGTIRVSAQGSEADRIAIVVSDEGPGIADAEKVRVTERFYRGEASAGRDGVGLGLSLVAAVARLHGGALGLSNGTPGLVAKLLLPIAKNVPATECATLAHGLGA
jgi:signal transduction histidine kinase